MIKQMHFAGVYVSDTDKAFDFYANKLGFQVHTDVDMGDNRWMEFVPAGAQTRIGVTKPWNDGTESRIGGFTNIVFATDDIQKTYEALAAAGVNFTEPPTKQSWGDVTAKFEDPDGNGFVLVEGDD
jgi:lactoylglutathione lyase